MLAIVLVIIWFPSKKEEELPPTVVEDYLTQPFTAKATIRLQDMTLETDINRTSPQKFTMKVTEPENLEGLQFTYDGETVGVSFKGMNLDVSDDSLAAKMMAKVLFYTINSASGESGVTVTQIEEGISIKGENEQGDFEILLNKENGSIIKFNMPNLEFECSFTDFLFQNGEAEAETAE